jgi:hypothetical protein
MHINKDLIKGFLLCALLIVLFLITTGGIQRPAYNITEDTTISFQSLFASDDGNVVYVIDNHNVYRSTDRGDNWTVVLAKKDEGY